MKKQLALKDVIVDRQFQPRHHGRDDDHTADLVEAYKGPDAEQIPDMVVFDIVGRGHVLVSGFNRYAALCKLNRKSATFVVKGGSVRDAINFAAGTNTDHGLKRSRKDKQRAIEMVHKANPGISDREAAKIAGVDHKTVAQVRTEIAEKEAEAEAKKNAQSGEFPTSPPESPEETTDSGSHLSAVIFEKDDGTPKMEGVYTPRFMDTSEGEKCIDLHGNPMPNKLGDLFADPDIRKRLAEFIDLSERFHAAFKAIEKLKKSEDYPFLDIHKMTKQAEAAREAVVWLQDHLREAIPTIVCPDCSGAGKGCKGKCRLTGYIPRVLYDLDPQFHSLRRKS